MTRHILYLVLLSALILSACGGGGGEATSTPDTSAQTASTPVETPAGSDATLAPETTPEPSLTPTDIGALEVPQPGTLVASVTEDPNASLVFNTVTLVRTGGPANSTLTIELRSDGTLIRDGETSRVTPEVVTRIDQMLDDLNFFGMQGAYLGPATNPQAYRYNISVDRADAGRSVNAQDGYMPKELQSFISAILDLGIPGRS